MGNPTHGNYDGWSDPFTGNGFTKSGDDIIPEYQSYPDAAGNAGVPMREGAEMWEVLPDGTQRLTGVLRDGEWIPQGNSWVRTQRERRRAGEPSRGRVPRSTL